MYNIDNVDIQILNLLKMDARTPLDELASQTGLTTSVISERLTNLENSGYIKGYHADIDLEKIGYKIRYARQEDKVPYMLIIGEKEINEGTVAVRDRATDQTTSMSLDDLIAKLNKEIAERI